MPSDDNLCLASSRVLKPTVDGSAGGADTCGMNDQIASAIRSVLKVIGGMLVTKGITDNSTVEIVIAGIIAAVGIGWSYWHHAATKATP